MVAPLLTSLIVIVALPLVMWIAGALYYDVGRATKSGQALALAWIAAALATLVLWQPAWKPVVALIAFAAAFIAWWFSQRPSHERNWNPNFAVLPRVEVDGDRVTIYNVRNTEYRTLEDCTPRFETRTYRLSNLCGVDALILYWGPTWMSHPMFVFDFGPDGRVCISIEVRYRVGQRFHIWRSLYRQQELIYVVSDERDAILLRTKCLPGHDMYLYRLNLDAATIPQFFQEYVGSINALSERPRWYNGVSANCTTSIYLQGRGRIPFHWGLLLNGGLDRLMYDRGLLDQSRPFEELKAQSWINDLANAAPAEGFGDVLRRALPGYQASGGAAEGGVRHARTIA